MKKIKGSVFLQEKPRNLHLNNVYFLLDHQSQMYYKYLPASYFMNIEFSTFFPFQIAQLRSQWVIVTTLQYFSVLCDNHTCLFQASKMIYQESVAVLPVLDNAATKEVRKVELR